MPPGNTFSGPLTVVEGTSSTDFMVQPLSVFFTGSCTPSDNGYGGSFTPAVTNRVNDVTAILFVYNAPMILGVATISPGLVDSVLGPITTIPPTLNITVVAAAPAPSQRIYYFPNTIGAPPPFGILQTINQLPAASVIPATGGRHQVTDIPAGMQSVGDVIDLKNTI